MKGKSMKELIEGGELKTFIDPLLIKALGHPVREHALAVFNERVASGSEIGEEIDADVSSFYHHIEELERLGCIELVETKRRRGAKEHFFRATRTVFFDDQALRELPASLRADLTVSFIQTILDEVVEAIEARTLNGSGDQHVSWTPGSLDERGWNEARKLLDETLVRVMEIHGESAERLARSDERGKEAMVAILGFETGKSDEKSAAS